MNRKMQIAGGLRYRVPHGRGDEPVAPCDDQNPPLFARYFLVIFACQFCLDKVFPLWFIQKINNFSRGSDDEKDIDEFQQYENEENPWIPRPYGHQGRPGRSQQKAGEGKKETDGIIPMGGPRAGRVGPGKGAVRYGSPNFWQRGARSEKTRLFKDLRAGDPALFAALHHYHVPESIGNQKTGHDGQQKSRERGTEK